MTRDCDLSQRVFLQKITPYLLLNTEFVFLFVLIICIII